MKIARWLVFGGAVGAGSYWLARYLRPEHSPLILNNSVVVITGASSGIGRAYANAFARRGVRLVLAARRVELLEQLRHEVAAYASDVLIIPTDVTDETQLKNLVDQTLQHFGQIDIVINNAGIGGGGLLQTIDPAEIGKMIDTNLKAAVILTRLCLPSMLARRYGKIINISSVAGRIGTPGNLPYNASKQGLIAFSDSLRREVDGTGVDVIAVLPNWTSSEMVPPAMEARLKSMGMSVDTSEYVAERTIEGLLKNEDEILFGGLPIRLTAWVERHFPVLVSLVIRYFVTPEMIARLLEKD